MGGAEYVHEEVNFVRINYARFLKISLEKRKKEEKGQIALTKRQIKIIGHI